MNSLYRPSILAAIFCLGFASAQSSRADDQPAKKANELEGTWKLVSIESDGKSNEPSGGQPRWVIKGNKVSYGGVEIAELKADASTSPRIIDLKLLDPERVFEGIYSLEEGTLKICLNRQTEGAKDRPGVFSTKDQSEWRMLVFEQDKDPKGDPNEGMSGFVGLMLQNDKENNTVVVASALKGTPADKAGFKKDDVILKVGGTAASDLRSTVNLVRKAKPGETLEIRIRRGTEESTITVKVGVLPFHFVADLG
jgi:uncharacterized protein (TIGR03067 family)